MRFSIFCKNLVGNKLNKLVLCVFNVPSIYLHFLIFLSVLWDTWVISFPSGSFGTSVNVNWQRSFDFIGNVLMYFSLEQLQSCRRWLYRADTFSRYSGQQTFMLEIQMQLSPLGEGLTKYAHCITHIFQKCAVRSIVPGPSGFRVLALMKSFSFISQWSWNFLEWKLCLFFFTSFTLK